MGAFLGNRLFEIIFVGVPVLLLVWLVTLRQRRKPSPEDRWAHAVQTCTVNPAFRLGQIVEVISSDPDRGEKARIAWHSSDIEQEIWFPQAWPEEDVWVVVSGEGRDEIAGHDVGTFYVTAVHDTIVM